MPAARPILFANYRMATNADIRLLTPAATMHSGFINERLRKR